MAIALCTRAAGVAFALDDVKDNREAQQANPYRDPADDANDFRSAVRLIRKTFRCGFGFGFRAPRHEKVAPRTEDDGRGERRCLMLINRRYGFEPLISGRCRLGVTTDVLTNTDQKIEYKT
jgi:hypothetical protein